MPPSIPETSTPKTSMVSATIGATVLVASELLDLPAGPGKEIPGTA